MNPRSAHLSIQSLTSGSSVILELPTAICPGPFAPSGQFSFNQLATSFLNSANSDTGTSYKYLQFDTLLGIDYSTQLVNSPVEVDTVLGGIRTRRGINEFSTGFFS